MIPFWPLGGGGTVPQGVTPANELTGSEGGTTVGGANGVECMTSVSLGAFSLDVSSQVVTLAW